MHGIYYYTVSKASATLYRKRLLERCCARLLAGVVQGGLCKEPGELCRGLRRGVVQNFSRFFWMLWYRVFLGNTKIAYVITLR